MKKKLLFSLTILILLIPVFGEEKKLTISIKGGFYSPSSSTFNNESVPSTNHQLKDIASWLNASGLSTNYDELDEFKGAGTFGGEFELFVLRRFSFAISTEHWKRASSASLEASGDVEGYLGAANYNIDFEVSLTPVLGTLRINFPYKKLRAYVGGGAGIYIGKFKLDESYKYLKNGSTVESEKKSGVAKGYSMIPHINGGFDFNITEIISIGLDFIYPFGKIKSFKIKTGSNINTVGDVLKFVDENGTEKIFQWELNGFNIGIFIRIKLD